MLDYKQWVEEYEENARRIQQIILREKERMANSDLSAEQKKTITNQLVQYRGIRRELIKTAHLLRQRCQNEN